MERQMDVVTQSILMCIELKTITPKTKEIIDSIQSIIDLDKQANGELDYIKKDIIIEVEEFFEGARYAWLDEDNIGCGYSKDNELLSNGYVIQNSKDSYLFYDHKSSKGTIGKELDIEKTNKWLKSNGRKELSEWDFDVMVYIYKDGSNWVYDKL